MEHMPGLRSRVANRYGPKDSARREEFLTDMGQRTEQTEKKLLNELKDTKICFENRLLYSLTIDMYIERRHPFNGEGNFA